MARETLNKLLLHSFTNYQIFYNDLRFHNHNAHHLCSLYSLGATDEQLEETYKTMCLSLVPYEISPNQITLSNWREYLGDRHYCKSYQVFFNEQLTTNWQKKFMEFLLDHGKPALINGVIEGVAHPLIHIGYALEYDNQMIAVEALAMTAASYENIHKIIENLKPPQFPSKSALEIFKDIRLDTQLPIYDMPSFSNIDLVVKDYTDHILTYYNQWKMDRDNLEKTIEELFDLAVYIYGATHKPNEIHFDFFLLHLVTSMHAIRIIYAHINDQQIMENILLQFFYFAMVVYTSQLRPEINEDLINDYEIDEKKKNWDYVIDRTLNTKFINDSHGVKVIRALRDADKVYGSKNNFYLKTAIKTVDHVDYDRVWIGRETDQRQLNVLKRL